MTLKERRDYHMSVECHKNVHNQFAALHSFFTPLSTIAVRTMRGTEAKQMSIPKKVTQTGRKAFSYRGPDHWNKLDVCLRNLDKVNPFKNQLLKEFMRDVNHPG